MQPNRRSRYKKSEQVLSFFLWTMLFAMAYCQSPLFTSNQNQYFLHGMAHAGVGYLNRDWLANTADPTPVFSVLVELTYRLIPWEPIFYGYYALLMGIYFFSLYGIVRFLFPIEKSITHKLFFIALFFLIHSAGLRFALSRLIGVNWTYVLEDGVADQRMLGSVFQPSTFGVFLLFSIYLFLDQRPYLAIASACLAAIFHPTYLLSAAVLTLAYMVLLFCDTHKWTPPLTLGFMALILVSPIVYQSFSIFGGNDAALVERARQILIEYRIPHHALIEQWWDATAVFKILFVVTALWITCKKQASIIILIPLSAAIILTVLQVITHNSALALIFPWRISTFLVPLSVAILLARFVNLLIDKIATHTSLNLITINVISMVLISLAVISGISRFSLDLMRKENIPERALFNFVSKNKKPTNMYLIPTKMQDFRLATGSPVFVEFKSIPYKDSDLIEWYRRITLNNRFYQDKDCMQLSSLIEKEGITHIVIESTSEFQGCPFLSVQYQDPNYMIYQVRH